MSRISRFIALLSFPLLFALAQNVGEGIQRLQMRRVVEAKSIFEDILKKDKKNADAHYSLGLILLRQDFRDEDAAIDHIEAAVELNPNNADYQYGLGSAYGLKAQSANMLKQAIIAPKVKRAFERAVELNPKHLQARMGLAEYYQQAPGIMGGDMEKAWKEADEIIALDEVAGRTFKARLYERDKRFDEAEKELKLMTGNQSKDWRSWRNIGFYYMRNQKPDEAVTSFQRYVSLKPDTADSHARLGQALLLKKSADKAIEACKKALALDKESMLAMSTLAEAYELKGQKKEAREQYAQVLNIETNLERRKNVEKKIKALQ